MTQGTTKRRTFSIPALELADLATLAREIADREGRHARIVFDQGRYHAVSSTSLRGVNVYVVFPDGSVEPWDDDKWLDYDDRARQMIVE
jgi:hypothetical protein